jgi:uncharacterized protein YndB with AHSA1/START domain
VTLQKLNMGLGVALGLQALLAVVMWWPSSNEAVESRSIVPMEAADVTELVIERKPYSDTDEVEPVRLVKEGEIWRIASAAGYPAQSDKVEEVIEHLVGMTVRRPVASNPTSHNALAVGPTDYGKKVTVRAGGETTSLIMGAASGKSVHVRLEGEDAVYKASGFSEWAVKDRNSSYWDGVYSKVEKEQLLSLSITGRGMDVSIEKGALGWTAGETPLDAAKVDQLLGRVATVRMRDPVGTVASPEHGFDDGVVVSWTSEDGDTTVGGGFVIGAEVDDNVYVKAEQLPFIVTVAKGTLTDVLEASVEALAGGDE